VAEGFAAMSGSVAVFDRDPTTGQLTQLPGTDGCVSDTGSGGCADGRALNGASDVAVSPDGANVYVAAGLGGLAVFDRDPVTGELAQKAGTAGCFLAGGADGCSGGGISSPSGVAVSPDGRNVYTVTGSGLFKLDRDVGTGSLDLEGCWSTTVGACTPAVALLASGGAVALSPDGRNLYVAAFVSNAVAVFDRDLVTGVLTQKASPSACVSETGNGGDCLDGVALLGPRDIAVSADGLNVYVASQTSDAVVVLNRHRATGALTLKLGSSTCVSETGTGGGCGNGLALDEPFSVAVSPDLRSVFAASLESSAVAVFDRTTTVGTFAGALSQKSGEAACVGIDETVCTDFDLATVSLGVAVSPDGRNVYAITRTGNGAITVLTRFVPAYDIDGDGEIDPLTDGLLQLRWQFGFTGATLVADAVDLANCTRCDAAAIEPYLEALASP
jgi:DNA-binding beta-propeller fold protein YncE